MSDAAKVALLAIGMVGAPQVLGFAVSRLLRRASLGPMAAASLFALGWYCCRVAATPPQQGPESLHRCGMGEAILMLVLAVMVVVHLVLGAVVQAVHACGGRQRQPDPAGAPDGT